jgi:ABC-type amino acid transport substrate-binding protein
MPWKRGLSRLEIKGFISRFNGVIEAMKSSGKIDEIIAKYKQ